MNRIILIGNGFDLAHGLPTGYCDFIGEYWTEVAKKLFDPYLGGEFEDEFIHIKHFSRTIDPFTKWKFKSWAELRNLLESSGDVEWKFKSPLFERINKCLDNFGWVDVENEYYALLKIILDENLGLRGPDIEEIAWQLENPGSRNPPANPHKLNDELKSIKEKLIIYLSKVNDNLINQSIAKDCMRSKIYEPFDIKDISYEGKDAFKRFVESRFSLERDEDSVRSFLNNFKGIEIEEFVSDLLNYTKHKKTLSRLLYDIIRQEESIRYFLLPDYILLLNFNYTKTAELYLAENTFFRVNHIHGELGKPNNPVIFGYGDELDEDYKKISNFNDNGYLTNIKSIRYLETDKYRHLLSIIEASPYQIYIMGHSCGNSDRTLLNTLFEHKNCVSIKPFYHKREDGSDNYIEIVQNISRNFNNMQKMRDRVVNKSYCRPLVEPEN